MRLPLKPSFFNRDLILTGLLFAAAFVAYLPAWHGAPLWDDDLNIRVQKLSSVAGLAKIWTHPGATVQYYPLVHSFFWLQNHLWGGSTTGYHLLNILLHFFSSLLLVKIVRKLGIPAAWLAGALFALHPVMVESVAWITEMKNTLSGFFFMGAALAYLTFYDGRKWRLYLLSIGLFILGLLSKSSIVPFPAAMLAVIWWKKGKIDLKRDLVPLLPFVAIGVLSGLVTIYMEHTYVGTRGNEFSFSFIERSLIAGRAFWFYLAKIIWPANLIFIYPRWNIDAGAWWQYLFPGAALVLAGLLAALRNRAPLAVLLYFAAMIFPVSGFISQYGYRFSFVADHWLYLAAAGPITLAAAGVHAISSRLCKTWKIPEFLVPVAVPAVLGFLSFSQSRFYADGVTLYRETIRKNPGCWMAYNNLGVLMANDGQDNEAVSCYRAALQLNPDFSNAHCNLGNVSARDGRVDEAIAHYREAIRIDPNYIEAQINLGSMLAQAGQTEEAVAHFKKALELDPNDAEARNNLGVLLAQGGRSDEAIAQFRAALELSPEAIDPLQNLAFTLVEKGEFNRAAALLRSSLAAAKSAGDQTRVEAITQIFFRLKETVGSLKAPSPHP